MEQHLTERDFFVSDSPTSPTSPSYAYTHVAHERRFELDRFPAINAWLALIAGLPG